MQKIIHEEAFIQVKSICSDDGEYRYTLTKIWDHTRFKGVVIGINPSRATHLKGDNTATNVMNYLIDQNFGEMTIVNLFPYRCIKPDDLKKRDTQYDVINLKYIGEVCEKADMILVIWGYESKYIEQKKKVEGLLTPYKEKVKCFSDSKGNKPQHLRIMSDSWECVSYF